VHEFSIASSIVEMVSSDYGALKVHEVRLRVGALAGVAKDALLFCYDIATADTTLAGSKLVVNEVPVILYCSVCREEKELTDLQRFRCPVCDTPSGDIRQGRDLEIESILIDEYAST
jgi:hydrogenase nickel incorporation protein HypA/HybF